MDKHINALLNLHCMNIYTKQMLKKGFELNVHHLKVLKYIDVHHEQEIFTTQEFKRLLQINQTMITHVISYLHDLGYYKKERSKTDERKVHIIVETRHKIKIKQLFQEVNQAFQLEFEDKVITYNKENLIGDMVSSYNIISSLNHFVNDKRDLNIDHVMILLYLYQSNNELCTLKELENKFNWDIVKINKTIKKLAKMNYIFKERNRIDERVVLVSINKDVEVEVKNVIDEVVDEYYENIEECPVAMVK
ncbi:transcriptional regulator, SarA/Rot family [Mammaliicoccus sp. Dog046]|uniref:transcriptional regulator, SarA/Rot family n=1 Tax=Mammaliicoccus sp. Dog046 TaxID=3034233 RepID=UPI002B25F47C|nr:hypothetical protein [Mammaliicoccus sp. Dog046]WQK85931.1 hypothetical protein P3U32_02555 [Mammaliicoccus sp. Dog046]